MSALRLWTRKTSVLLKRVVAFNLKKETYLKQIPRCCSVVSGKKSTVKLSGINSRPTVNQSNLQLVESPLHRILAHLPGNIQMAFAYGSGVFEQEGHQDMSKNMVDFLIAVDDPVSWHRENIRRNGKHYSFLKYIGPVHLTKFQSQCGAGVYFNTLIECEGRLIKYGVVSTEKLITDLLDWDCLYVSGRLHKPVRVLKAPSDSSLISALEVNLRSAIHSALLILPEEFSEKDLFTVITGLSYKGDFRMFVGEDKNKIKNIVNPNMERFRQLYENELDKEEHVFWDKNKGRLEQYPNHAVQYHHLSLLPKMVQLNLVAMRNPTGRYYDTEEVIRSLAQSSQCDMYVAKSIEQIVKKSSLKQSIKTILTAGLKKSVTYSMNKLKKMLKSSKNIY